LKKWFLDYFECHWLCQCREIVVFFSTGKASGTLFQKADKQEKGKNPISELIPLN
jgi:hypothetical protein